MSLRETIEGAKQEAQQNLSTVSTTKGDDEEREGFSRKSATRAKPTREAAAGVRTGERVARDKLASDDKATRKAAEAEERERENRRRYASDIVMQADPDYKPQRKHWIISAVVGIGAALLGIILVYLVLPRLDQSSDLYNYCNVFTVICMVLAYAAVIYSFVVDFRKLRPIRNAAQAKIDGMTDKRVEELIKKAEAAEADGLGYEVVQDASAAKGKNKKKGKKK